MLSESLREVIPALLTLDSVTRRIVAFPILISSSQELAFSVCGCESDDDEDALYALVSGKKSEASRTVLSEVFSLYPEEDKIDEVIIHAARYISRSLMFSWRYDEKTPPVVRFIPAITAISQGLSSAESMDQISCVFEAVATTSMTAREE